MVFDRILLIDDDGDGRGGGLLCNERFSGVVAQIK